MEILVIILVSLTIAEMMFAMGLRLSFSELADSVRKYPWIAGRAAAINYLVIPAITIIAIRIFRIPPMAGTGLLLLGVSPAAPYGPPFTAIARGNLSLSAGLMILLAGSSAFMVPLLLCLGLPLIAAGGLSLHLDTARLIGTLFIIQLLPLCLGLSIGQWNPRTAARLISPASHLSKVLNALMILTIAYLQFNIFQNARVGEILIMGGLVGVSLTVGWLTGGSDRSNRITVSIITAMRNMSLSMGIAAASFPGTIVVTTVMIYSFIAGLGVLAFAFRLRNSV